MWSRLCRLWSIIDLDKTFSTLKRYQKVSKRCKKLSNFGCKYPRSCNWDLATHSRMFTMASQSSWPIARTMLRPYHTCKNLSKSIRVLWLHARTKRKRLLYSKTSLFNQSTNFSCKRKKSRKGSQSSKVVLSLTCSRLATHKPYSTWRRYTPRKAK